MAKTIKQMLSMTKKELILAIEGLEAENQELIHLLADANDLLRVKNEEDGEYDHHAE